MDVRFLRPIFVLRAWDSARRDSREMEIGARLQIGLRLSGRTCQAVVFLASADASFITGAALLLDGGAAQV